MATRRRTSNALPVAQVSTITVANTWATSDTGTITCNGKDLVLTVGAITTTTGIAAAIAAMLTGDTALGTETRSETGDNVPEFTEFTALASGSTVILTGATKGKPFTVTVSENTAGSGTLAIATTTAATGPNHWSNADNWDSAVPVTGTNEQQTITIDATGGTFTITFSGQTTSALAYNASAATVQAALEALSTIGAGNVSVGLATLVYTLTFRNTLGYQNVAAVTTGAGSLTGGAGTATVATTVPGVTGDDVYLENSAVDILYDLDQSAVALNSLNIAASYTGKVGLPDTSESGAYWEYRAKYLTLLGATTLRVGHGQGAGSSRLKINVGSSLCTATVEKTASPAEQGLPSLLLQGSNAYSVLNASEGSVGVAVEAGQTSTLLTVRCGYEASIASDVQMILGAGCTLTTVNQTGGDLEINASCTTLNRTGGTCTLKGASACTTINNDGGTLYDQSTGTKGTVNVGSGSTLDRSRTMLGATYTTTNLYKGAKLVDPFKTITFTNPMTLVRCGVKDVDLDLGLNLSLQRS